MREYKFRGKRVDNCEWVYGGLAVYGEHAFIVRAELQISESDNVYFSTTGIEIDHATVGQYTGLKDKNGVEIYEGDIIQDVQHKLFIVFWDDKECAFKLDHKYCHHRDGDECHTHLPMYSRKGEIIGNIHDNSDLLQK